MVYSFYILKLIALIYYKIEMSEEDSQSSENVLEKIKKKYKKDQPNISIDENIDVRDVAIQKYKEMKN